MEAVREWVFVAICPCSRSEGSRGSCGGLYIELMVISALPILILILIDVD